MYSNTMDLGLRFFQDLLKEKVLRAVAEHEIESPGEPNPWETHMANGKKLTFLKASLPVSYVI